MTQGSLPPTPQDHAVQGSVNMLQQYHQPAAVPQPYQVDQQPPFSDVPHNMAAPTAPYTDLSASAMQYAAADGAYRQELFTSHVHGQPLLPYSSPEGGPYLPQPGPSTPAGFTGVIQHPLPAHGPQTPVQQPTAELYTAGLTNTGEVAPSSAEGLTHGPAGSGDLEAGRVPVSTPAKMGFGGILSGVVKEAAETATKRPPVFRYEDFKTVSCPLPLPMCLSDGLNICCSLCFSYRLQARQVQHSRLGSAAVRCADVYVIRSVQKLCCKSCCHSTILNNFFGVLSY